MRRRQALLPTTHTLASSRRCTKCANVGGKRRVPCGNVIDTPYKGFSVDLMPTPCRSYQFFETAAVYHYTITVAGDWNGRASEGYRADEWDVSRKLIASRWRWCSWNTHWCRARRQL